MDEDRMDLPREGDNGVEAGDEEESGIVELTDEDGQTKRFEHLQTIEYENDTYLVLIPLDDDDDEAGEEDEAEEEADEDGGEADGEQVEILKIEKDEKGEDIYVSCDDDLSQKIFDLFMEQLDEEDEG